VPQEGHNFVFPENGFFHLSSLFEGKILIFRGEMGLGTIFFRMYSDFKKKRAKKVEKFCIFFNFSKMWFLVLSISNMKYIQSITYKLVGESKKNHKKIL
jgi:hypothetical protein